MVNKVLDKLNLIRLLKLKRGIEDYFKKYFYASFFKFIPHFYGNYVPKSKITCESILDGGGSQFQARLSTQLLAHDFNIDYIHSRPKSIAHKPMDISMEEWVSSWESFFNFQLSYPIIQDEKVVRKSLFWALTYLRFSKKIKIYSIKTANLYADMHPDNYYKLMPNLKKNLINLPLTEKTINSIVVHVRRGDVSNNIRTKHRYTESERIYKNVVKILERHPDQEYEIYFFSNSYDLSLDVKFINGHKCYYDSQSDIFTVLKAIINADIFMMSKSSVSYVGALYSNAEIYYEDFWHKPLKNWINVTSI